MMKRTSCAAGILLLSLAARLDLARASTCESTYVTSETCNANVASGTDCAWDAAAGRCGPGKPLDDGTVRRRG